MKPKHQRLVLALTALGAITGSSLLAMSALKDQASYFYSPGDIDRAQVPPGRAIRLGGMVRKGSLRHAPDGVTMTFIVEDDRRGLNVSFRGLPPDLFREGSGIVAEGVFKTCPNPNSVAPDHVMHCGFVATNLLAKHDENYMPPKAKGEQHVTKSLKE